MATTENNNAGNGNGNNVNNNNGNNGNGQPNNGGQQQPQPQPEAAPKRGFGKILLTVGGAIIGAGAVLLICRKKIFGD